MARVLLESVTKQFPDGTIAVDDINLEIVDREFLVLVGPSGCGKSTTLRLIAGLETNTSGEVFIGERAVTRVAPKDRDIAMVFQNYALYPHMSVYKNLSFGLTLRYGGGVLARGLRRITQPRRAAELAQLRAGIDNKVRQTALRLGIEHLLDRKPHQLSGGERQRVALGRAIVRNPAAFLFDEPLSNLDAKLRQLLRAELKRLHRELNATMIYVTHDQVEAMTLGDRVAVMNDGKILQVGKPLDIYQRPANLFVAKFIGNVPINLSEGTVKQMEGGSIRFVGPIQIEWPIEQFGSETAKQLLETNSARPVVLGFRAEDVRRAEYQSGFEVVINEMDQLGESSTLHCNPVTIEKDDNLNSSILVRVEPDTNLKVGDHVQLHVEPGKVIWFDPKTGENLLRV